MAASRDILIEFGNLAVGNLYGRRCACCNLLAARGRSDLARNDVSSIEQRAAIRLPITTEHCRKCPCVELRCLSGVMPRALVARHVT
jgi:hypothetical protein